MTWAQLVAGEAVAVIVIAALVVVIACRGRW
jgi:hypothetical protein